MAADSTAILIADSDAVVRRFVGALLTHSGYLVHEAADGEAAVRQAAAIKPRLIILDVLLPGRDGYEVINTLKADPATAGIPVMALSVKDREEDVVKALNLGAEDYVTKPFSTQELLARIRKILARSG